MAYEIDFLGIKEETQDATAICFRWENVTGEYTIGVFDGGFNSHGEELVKHLNKYYFSGKDNVEEKIINFVICSHPHQDHASGLSKVLENFKVQKLYMNKPWDYTSELYNKVKDEILEMDGRITEESLEKRLKSNYQYISNLEEIANKNDIPIYSALEGTVIGNRLTVLSPSKDFYLELLAESQKTPVEKKDSLFESAFEFAKNIVNLIKESWTEENLREGVTTESDNETSTVILAEMEEETFLLTGDAGIRALQKAINYSNEIKKSIKDTVTIYEIPHHGGRHNVSPSILNEILGEIVDENVDIGKQAYTCTGKGTDHPKQMVVNAFKRRGVKVYNASGSTICHHKGDMPKRGGWSSATELEFKDEVEEWK